MHPSRRWGFAAAGWSAAFAALHLYWALGGSIGPAESAGAQLAEQRPPWFVVAGLYGVAALLAAAAALGVIGRGLCGSGTPGSCWAESRSPWPLSLPDVPVDLVLRIR